jgi:peptide/nickel transport system permease protein
MTLNFLLVNAMPGDPILNMVPRDPKLDQGYKDSLIEKFHLNESLPERYVTYLWNTVTFDWGNSYSQDHREVVDIVFTDMRWTILLIGTSTIFTLLLGMLIGAYGAYRRGGAFDMSSTALMLFFYGMPIFWFGMMLQMLFQTTPLGMDWWPQLPPSGYYDYEAYGTDLKWDIGLILSILKHLILPATTLAIGSLAGVAIVMRSSLLDVLSEDFILTARAKGLTDFQVLRHHAMPNGMPPMIALIALSLAFVIGGAYQIEYVFSYPGIGYTTLNAIWQLDFPILQFIVVIGGVAVVIANFLADIILIFIDPRIKIA